MHLPALESDRSPLSPHALDVQNQLQQAFARFGQLSLDAERLQSQLDEVRLQIAELHGSLIGMIHADGKSRAAAPDECHG